MTTSPELSNRSQSLWLHYLRRSYIESGELGQMLDEQIRGVTVDLSVIAQAISCSADYDRPLTQLLAEGTSIDELPYALLVDDVQRAAAIFHAIYEESQRLDGYISLPIDPALAHDTTETVAAVRHLLAEINAPNVMVEIPATEAGISAIKALTRDGVCVNATLIFSLETYQQVVDAYLDGLADYVKSHSIWRRWPTSVATIAVSRLDRAVDEWLAQQGRTDLLGKAGVALAEMVYHLFQINFTSPRWQKMAKKGVQVQRPLWAGLTPRDFRFPESYYLDALAGLDSVCRLTPANLNAYRDSRKVVNPLFRDKPQARAHLQMLIDLGLDLEAVARELQEDGLASLKRDFWGLRESVRQKREQLEDHWQRLEMRLGHYTTAVNQALTRMTKERVICRIWNQDHTVWQPEPDEIRNRLGWLHLVPVMREQIDELQAMTEGLVADGFTHALHLGMGGSGLAPQLFADTFSKAALPPRPGLPPRPHLHLEVLANTDPATILGQAKRIDPARTLFIVASKSGRTVETQAAFNYFYNQVEGVVGTETVGRHFIAITDPGSSLAEMAEKLQFRHIFYNQPHLTGRFAALSYIGLVPAALAGVNLETVLDRGLGMACNAHGCNPPQVDGDNLAAQLGAALGVLALAGRDKLTFITSPALAGFADWVEQLLAESTGKDGRGIVPVVGEPVGKPDVYGDDRLFVHLRLDGDSTQDTAVTALAGAGFPIISLHWRDLSDLGGQFFLWQMATAVAAHYLGVNPFSQPQTDAVKAQTWEMVARYRDQGETHVPDDGLDRATSDGLKKFLDQARLGDYIVLQAFTPRNDSIDEALQKLRLYLRDRTRLATTVGYGPRCLHTTGQMHMDDRGNGLIVQLMANVILDVLLPDEPGRPEASMTFGALKEIQALVEARALRQARRRLLRFHLGADAAASLQQLVSGVTLAV